MNINLFRNNRNANLNWLLLTLSVCLTACIAEAERIDVGAGSYSTVFPDGFAAPPAVIYKTDNLTGPVPTNDWCSSILWQKFSSNHYAHPLAMLATETGLHISYPGPSSYAYEGHIIAGFQDELTIGHSGAAQFPDARLDGFSDWFVDVLFKQGDNSMRLSYGHGSPFVYAMYENGSAKITFNDSVTVWSGDGESAVLGVTVKGRHYGLFGPAGSTWSGLGSREFINDNTAAGYFSLAILPDNRSETLAFYSRYAYTHIVGTKVQWSYLPQNGTVKTDYTFQTIAREGSMRDTIFAMYPHQWKNSAAPLTSYSYKSIRGTMKVAAGTSFSTEMAFNGILPSMPGRGSCDFNQLSQYVSDAAGGSISNPADTYWAGKSLGVIAKMIPISAQLGLDSARQQFTNTLKARLEDWFTAPQDGQSETRYFAYNDNWGALIGIDPSYGSGDELNDHHFHYGYFIRAAAEIARSDKAWAGTSRWAGMVELLVRDTACPDRNDAMFPFLRNFDPYAGHSWACGHARFADGNNQESSSEAMNAWTGLILWGQATGNLAIRDLGIYLYVTEMNAINAYWFDTGGELFPSEYKRETAGMIWGSKIDFSTWFSADAQHIVGINLLPMQPGSLYLGLNPEYIQRNLSGLAGIRDGGFNWNTWQDTFWMYEALSNPVSAMSRFQAGKDVLDSFGRAFAYHWIGNMQVLGQFNGNITADYPLAVAFSKAGQTTYIASNTTAQRLTVTFSDGTQLSVEPEQTEKYIANAEPSELNAVNVFPSSVTAPEGTVTLFSASGSDQYGQDFPVAVDWSASGGGVIDENGAFVAVDKGGPYTVRARDCNGTISGNASVTVSEGNLASDYDGSLKTDVCDVSRFASFWLHSDCDAANDYCSGCDHASDGDVDLYDLDVILESWLKSSSYAGNVVLNGGFELGDGADAGNWQENGNSVVAVERSSEAPRSGDWSAKISLDNASTGYSCSLEQTTGQGSVAGGQNCGFYFYIKGEMSGVGIVGRSEVVWLDAGGGRLGSSLASFFPREISPASYSKISQAGLSAPANASAARLSIRLEGPANTSGTLYIDDILLN